jgi:phosphatidylserine/phosphatidylglycerophosphate/cardiolipin synthase-like enzyme
LRGDRRPTDRAFLAFARYSRFGEDGGVPGLDDWFLSRAERGNPRTTVDATRERAWTEANSAHPLIHGRNYFPRLAAELRLVGRGDEVWILDWRGDADERLDDEDLGTLLVGALARGADVRGLVWRSHPDEEKFNEQENAHLARVVNEAGGEILLDERVRRFGSHHQKLVLIRRADAARDVAFVGGIDLCHGRGDDEAHLGDPQVVPLDRRYGPRPAWHDAQVEIAGPAVGDLARTFRERWEDPTPIDHRNPVRARIRRVVREPLRPRPLPPERPDPAGSGAVAVQVLRTYPAKRPPFPFAPDGERSVARGYAKAIARAVSLIYIEDQYLWSRAVADVVAAALERTAELRAILVVPRFPDRDGRLTGVLQRVGQMAAIERLRRAGDDRVAVYDLEGEGGRPIYVHAKVCIVDDVWIAIGSDNLNVRSWTNDSELTCALVDSRRDAREPSDPGGRGEGARVLARDTRLRLWREHLGPGVSDEELLPPRAFGLWRERASALDAWASNGGAGARPPGRVRTHRPEPIPWWATWWSTRIHRLAIDPDGRPRRFRGTNRF